MMDEQMARAEKMRALQERDGLGARQERVQEALGQLGELIERLESRLQPVLRDPGPTAALQGSVLELPASPLGGFLRGVHSHTQELAGRVTDLLERVDL